jgi:GABA(A) receptor-associated protein
MSTETISITPEEVYRLRSKFPDHVPVFVSRSPSSRDIPTIDKHKYIVPKHLSVGQFIYTIRCRLRLAPDKALFLYIDNNLPLSSMNMGEVYQKYSRYGFIHCIYAGESTFGYGHDHGHGGGE